MSPDMTPVYSGGILYEYSKEQAADGDFGLVDLATNTERPDFASFKMALAKSLAPTGDGGYKQSGQVSQCPQFKDPTWLVRNSSLPLMPAGAQIFMKSGAGPGPGYKNINGSQWAGTPTSGWGPLEDGSVSSTSQSASPSSDKKSKGNSGARPAWFFVALATVAMSAL